jgi:hypothetical protein
MSLRKSPCLTPALFASNRRSTKKSAGPRTARGKAWSQLNHMRDGWHSFKERRWRRAEGMKQKERISFFDVRSRNVYENKQPHDQLSDKKATFLRNFRTFSTKMHESGAECQQIVSTSSRKRRSRTIIHAKNGGRLAGSFGGPQSVVLGRWFVVTPTSTSPITQGEGADAPTLPVMAGKAAPKRAAGHRSLTRMQPPVIAEYLPENGCGSTSKMKVHPGIFMKTKKGRFQVSGARCQGAAPTAGCLIQVIGFRLGSGDCGQVRGKRPFQYIENEGSSGDVDENKEG